MTEFGNYLTGIMAESKMTGAEFAEKIHVDPSNLSRILSGAQKQIRGNTLQGIIKNATDDAKTQAHLLAAYLRDQRVGPATEMVSIVVKGASPSKVSNPDADELFSLVKANLAPRFIRDLTAILKAYQKNKNFEAALHTLAVLAADL